MRKLARSSRAKRSSTGLLASKSGQYGAGRKNHPYGEFLRDMANKEHRPTGVQHSRLKEGQLKRTPLIARAWFAIRNSLLIPNRDHALGLIRSGNLTELEDLIINWLDGTYNKRLDAKHQPGNELPGIL